MPVKAAAGYLAGYADPDFIDELNTFTLPMLCGGNYRAFEIIGDSMLPTQSGSVIVGEKVEDIDGIKTSNTYIVVSRNEGIVYKRVLKSNRSKNKVTLVSDNPLYEPYQVMLRRDCGNMAGPNDYCKSQCAAALGCEPIGKSSK